MRAGQNRRKRAAVNVVQRRRADQLQQRLAHILQPDAGIANRRRRHARASHYQGNVVRLLKGDDVLAVQPMRAEKISVIRCHHHDCVFKLLRNVHPLQQTPELLVDLADGGVIAGRGLRGVPDPSVAPDLRRPPVQIRLAAQVVVNVWLQRDRFDIILRERVFVAVEGVVRFGEADKTAPGRAFVQG